MDTTTISVEFMAFGERIKAEIPVPVEPITPIFLLPILQQLTDSLVHISVEKIQQEGKEISCKSGCGACCRQLVPVTESEAYLLLELIETMPKKRRNEIWQRFDDAVEMLEELDFVERLEELNELNSNEIRELGEQYFQLGIPCPFLEKESCSIYHNRPLACREYLVTSPAINCSTPQPEFIEIVPMAASVSVAAAQIDEPLHSAYVREVPLILAPLLAEEYPDESQPRLAVDMMRTIFSRLARKNI
jgi:Fe-S-cluster containining protein